MKNSIKYFIAIALLTIVMTGCECRHKTWIEATCTTPRTCADCGITEGEPLGHKWKEATCDSPKTCEVCGETEGEPLEHVWLDATCTDPKTCKLCGKTEGKPLGHKWEKATCTKPKTCSVCGETEGETLEHTWIEATCTEPKKCKVCGEEDGEPLGHTYENGICTRCGEKDPSRIELSSVSSIDDLEEYLNQNYSTLETPYGKIDVSIEIDRPETNTDLDLYGYDMYIQCDADFTIHDPVKTISAENDWVYLPYDLDNLNVTDSERQEIAEIMKTYQKSIADDAMSRFPSSCIKGGFYNSWSSGWTDYGWHDGGSNQYFTWTNYFCYSNIHYESIKNKEKRSSIDIDYIPDDGGREIAGFSWVPDGDDHWYGYNDDDYIG